MDKEKLIKEFLSTPIQKGEKVYVRGLGTQDKNAFHNATEVLKVKKDGIIIIKEFGSEKEIKPENYQRNTIHIGANPFPEKPWNSRLRIINFSLHSILFACGFERDKRPYKTKDGEKVIPEVNWNPHFIDEEGNEVVYQRDFCWSLKDKQLLIESIYNNIDIGKIVVRLRPFKYVVERAGEGKEVGFRDIVDGKQRLSTLLAFVNNEFEDLHGNKYSDLSDIAQHKFNDFMSVAYGEIGEDATDEDVKAVFLGVNFAGVPMSSEHVEFVKSIKLK